MYPANTKFKSQNIYYFSLIYQENLDFWAKIPYYYPSIVILFFIIFGAFLSISSVHLGVICQCPVVIVSWLNRQHVPKIPHDRMETQAMDTFGSLVASYRRRAKMSQEELGKAINLHATDVSKIERHERKPPKLDHTLKLIEALHLTNNEATELLQVGGYPTTVLQMKYDPTVYPPTTREQAETRLKGDRGYWPVWILDEKGTVLAANLLILWVWEGLLGDKLDAAHFLNFNVFDIYSRPENIKRIAMPQKVSDFLYTKILVFKKLEELLPPQTVSNFKEVILNHPVLRLIYLHADNELGEEWSYTLKILQPHTNLLSEHREEYLEFEGSVERIIENDDLKGYVVTYQPLKGTIKFIEQEFHRLIEHFGKEAYVQYQGTHAMDELPKYPSFYPFLTHDVLFYITGENNTHHLMVGEDIVGKHFLELFVSGQVREMMGESLADTTALNAMQAFFILTAPYQKEQHPIHVRYEQVREYLSSSPKFENFFDIFWNRFTPSDFSRIPQDGEVQCEPLLTCRFCPDFRLSFLSISYFPTNQRPDYIIMLEPTNTETKIALILLHLDEAASAPEYIGMTEPDQLRWFLAVLKTVSEGITKGLTDTQWEPESAFQRIQTEFTVQFGSSTQQIEEKLRRQVQIAFLELYLQEGVASREAILDIFISFTKEANYIHNLLMRKYEPARNEQSTQFP